MSSLLHLIGQLFLFCLLVIACGAVLRRVAMAAFGGGSRSPRPAGGRSVKALRSPAPRAIAAAGGKAGRSAAAVIAHPRNSTIRTQARADIRKMREEARLTNWIAGQEHARANGTTGTATATATRPTLAQRLRLVPFVAQPQDPGNGGSANGGQPANGTGTQPPAQGNGGPPARQSPPPQAPPTTNGGTPVAGTSTASAEKLIEGINEIHAHAAAGGIHAKREALAAMHEGAVRFAAMAQMVARTMSEPGSNYGNEITEPIAKGGQQFQAGAITIGEAEASLATLINMTVGDLATSARQAPHHRELSENGSH